MRTSTPSPSRRRTSNGGVPASNARSTTTCVRSSANSPASDCSSRSRHGLSTVKRAEPARTTASSCAGAGAPSDIANMGLL
ncbi:hypothetical protein [Litorihabitans aurantiacus]|uniref:hypothetical protein n=1 Tax=Litorihabitans aurantiacus TaxID=1930061 RepID=UPI0024E06048|nr:hypothetical protein [Litorihabitans aurantiacus]